MVRRAISNLSHNSSNVTEMGRVGWFPAQLLSDTRESTWVSSILQRAALLLSSELSLGVPWMSPGMAQI